MGTIDSGGSTAFTVLVTPQARGALNALVSVSGTQVDRDSANDSVLVRGQALVRQ